VFWRWTDSLLEILLDKDEEFTTTAQVAQHDLLILLMGFGEPRNRYLPDLILQILGTRNPPPSNVDPPRNRPNIGGRRIWRGRGTEAVQFPESENAVKLGLSDGGLKRRSSDLLTPTIAKTCQGGCRSNNRWLPFSWISKDRVLRYIQWKPKGFTLKLSG
jgi:hypothetical protein